MALKNHNINQKEIDKAIDAAVVFLKTIVPLALKINRKTKNKRIVKNKKKKTKLLTAVGPTEHVPAAPPA